MEERRNYIELKQDYMLIAFDACASKFHLGKVGKWVNNETEYGYVDYNFECCFRLPIDHLMWYVISIIVHAGRNYTCHKIRVREIKEILRKNDINNLISDFDEEERGIYERSQPGFTKPKVSVACVQSVW